MDYSNDLICENLTAVDGVLHFAGQNTAVLAQKYGTPLYLMDENRIRQQVSIYRDTLRECFGDKGHALYASKACSFNFSADRVSKGTKQNCIKTINSPVLVFAK